MDMYTNLTGYRIYVGDKENLVRKINNHLLKENTKLNIVSGNPEVLFNGLNDKELKNLFDREDNVIIPDGVGVTFLIKFLKGISISKIAGIDIMGEVLRISRDNGFRVYIVGATDENLKLAIDNIERTYEGINIVGSHNGYFSDSDKVIDEITLSYPDVLFVAMGSPRQDIFIKKCMDKITSKIFMGVGGSLDLYAGKLNRAPKIMINLGCEWLYRVYKEPFRIKRLLSIPKFMIRSVKYHLKGRV